MLATVSHWGLLIGVLGTCAVASGALFRHHDDAENVELTAVAVSMVVVTTAAVACLCTGGWSAFTVLLGSSVVGVIVAATVITLLQRSIVAVRSGSFGRNFFTGAARRRS